MQLTRWRTLFSLKSHAVPSTTSRLSSAFHSTPSSSQKWKNNKPNSDVRRNKQTSKNHIRFVTHEKQTDAKKALKDLLYNSGSSRFSSQKKETWKLDEDHNWCEDQDDHSDGHDKKGHSRSRRKFGNSQKKVKRKIRRESFCEDHDGYSETIFHATFGNRSSTWSFCDWQGSSFRNSASGFDHGKERENSNWTNRSRFRRWTNASDAESSDNESCCVGLLSDRTTLGLPPTGPLKIEDVKNAFQLSAFKWHPDKYQGPSQAMAGEKFRLCMDAYKSLCSAISSA